MFLGRYAYTVDEKGRLTIPARFREALTGDVVITRGLDRCLTVYPAEVWQELAAKVNALPITDPRGRSLRRLLFAEAESVKLDRHGRVLLSEWLRKYAELTPSAGAIIVGLDRFLEIWNPTRWEAENAHQIAMMEEDPALWETLHL